MSGAQTAEIKGAPLPPAPPIQRFFGSVPVSVAIYFAVVGFIVWGSLGLLGYD